MLNNANINLHQVQEFQQLTRQSQSFSKKLYGPENQNQIYKLRGKRVNNQVKYYVSALRFSQNQSSQLNKKSFMPKQQHRSKFLLQKEQIQPEQNKTLQQKANQISLKNDQIQLENAFQANIQQSKQNSIIYENEVPINPILNLLSNTIGFEQQQTIKQYQDEQSSPNELDQLQNLNYVQTSRIINQSQMQQGDIIIQQIQIKTDIKQPIIKGQMSNIIVQEQIQTTKQKNKRLLQQKVKQNYQFQNYLQKHKNLSSNKKPINQNIQQLIKQDNTSFQIKQRKQQKQTKQIEKISKRKIIKKKIKQENLQTINKKQKQIKIVLCSQKFTNSYQEEQSSQQLIQVPILKDYQHPKINQNKKEKEKEKQPTKIHVKKFQQKQAIDTKQGDCKRRLQKQIGYYKQQQIRYYTQQQIGHQKQQQIGHQKQRQFPLQLIQNNQVTRLQASSNQQSYTFMNHHQNHKQNHQQNHQQNHHQNHQQQHIISSHNIEVISIQSDTHKQSQSKKSSHFIQSKITNRGKTKSKKKYNLRRQNCQVDYRFTQNSDSLYSSFVMLSQETNSDLSFKSFTNNHAEYSSSSYFPYTHKCNNQSCQQKYQCTCGHNPFKKWSDVTRHFKLYHKRNVTKQMLQKQVFKKTENIDIKKYMKPIQKQIQLRPGISQQNGRLYRQSNLSQFFQKKQKIHEYQEQKF